MTGERDLMAAGFTPKGDGTLHAPARITLTPAGEFYRVTIELPSGDALTCFVARVALKTSNGEKT
jgi:hypothetical protein